jgi:hypothetical protein
VLQQALLELHDAAGPNTQETREAQVMAARLSASSSTLH